MSGTTNVKRGLYMNTLVFCLLGGLISLGLLAVLVYGGSSTKALAPFIITIEIGLIGIVIYAIVVISRNNARALNQARNAADNLIAVRSCPDYWILSTKTGVSTGSDDDDDAAPAAAPGSGKPVCLRRYISPSTTDGTAVTTDIYVVQGKKDTLALGDIHNTSLRNVCSTIQNEGAAWTDLSPICNAYNQGIAQM